MDINDVIEILKIEKNILNIKPLIKQLEINNRLLEEKLPFENLCTLFNLIEEIKGELQYLEVLQDKIISTSLQKKYILYVVY